MLLFYASHIVILEPKTHWSNWVVISNSFTGEKKESKTNMKENK